MNFYNIHYASRKKIERRFGDNEELESKYVPVFPYSAERDYQKLARDIQRDFDRQFEPYMIAAINAIMMNQSLPSSPTYQPPDYLQRRIRAIATKVERHAIRQWSTSVRRTLGIEINRDYYHSMVSAYMQNWIIEQERLILDRIQTKITELMDIFQTPYETVQEIATTADRKSGQIQSSINTLAISNVAIANALMAETFAKDAGNEKYRWKIRPYASMTGTRADHAILDGEIFHFDDPPVTDHRTGAKNNPGQDFNCHCVATHIYKKLSGVILAATAVNMYLGD